MIKLAIIGASYLQEPLIRKAKSRGIETHVFAWQVGDVGETLADYFYPISIVEKDNILNKCREIGIDGVCSIASDLAVMTVNYVASEMGLTGNSMETTLKSTNKHKMRKCFAMNGDPSPKSLLVESMNDIDTSALRFPVIVKPLDRSGSRGITKVENERELPEAIEKAKAVGFEKSALVEEYLPGDEYSVEFISYQGEHNFLAMTKKYTTGAPGYIETGHLEPADVSDELLKRVREVVVHALDGLGIINGATHTELKIDASGHIGLIEIGGRMGGDFIGSDLVELSTGYDYVNAVIDVALGEKPKYIKTKQHAAGVRFVFDSSDIDALEQLKKEHPEYLVSESVKGITDSVVSDSSSRFGYFLMKADSTEELLRYLPKERT